MRKRSMSISACRKRYINCSWNYKKRLNIWSSIKSRRPDGRSSKYWPSLVDSVPLRLLHWFPWSKHLCHRVIISTILRIREIMRAETPWLSRWPLSTPRHTRWPPHPCCTSPETAARYSNLMTVFWNWVGAVPESDATMVSRCSDHSFDHDTTYKIFK